MSQQDGFGERRRRGGSLSLRISFYLIAAALLPLLAMFLVSQLNTRPTLVDQSRRAMVTDAHTHVQLIENYLSSRLLDVQSLAQVPLATQFFTQPETREQTGKLIIQNGSVVGKYLDKNYTLWALFDLQGKPLLSYSANNTQFKPHGKYPVSPEAVQKLQTLQGGDTPGVISDVYYDPETGKASVDLYVVSFSFELNKPVGLVRATLNLDYIWDQVQEESGANGEGSYAFILNQHGVRIADPDKERRFTAIAPLSADVQQAMNDEERYGKDSTVEVKEDQDLYSRLTQNNPPQSFEMTPTDANEPYEVTQQKIGNLGWTYLVLSPVSTIVRVANEQLLVIAVIAIAMLILATLLGIAIGRRISAPIKRAVILLRENSNDLATLSSRQKSAAAEQVWVVDSSQVGLKSVQYYNEATNVATERLNKISTELLHNWERLSPQTINDGLVQINNAAQYIQKAVNYQNSSNEKLATAINVTTQVSEQLASGATSTLDASRQLKEVVGDLQQIVGD